MADLVPLEANLPQADLVFLALSCPDCEREAHMGLRRAVRLAAGRPTAQWLARLRCQSCGHQGARLTVCADVRGAAQQERDGPLPVTQEK